MTVFERVDGKNVPKLLSLGFKREQPKTAYEQLRLQGNGVTLVFYTSGKLLLQGVPDAVKKVAKKLEKLGLGHPVEAGKFRPESGWIIGSDESLKGDTFGGLVVAAVKADNSIRQQLIEMGVADSKTLEDEEIRLLAEKIKKIALCEVRSILPEEYNRKNNVTDLLNHLHQACAQDLFPGTHVIDKYPGCTVGVIQEEKAESKYVEVAAASILARSAALQQLHYLSTLAGFQLPKGSTHVQLALVDLQRRGLEFRKFVKIDFRNVKEFLMEEQTWQKK